MPPSADGLVLTLCTAGALLVSIPLGLNVKGHTEIWSELSCWATLLLGLAAFSKSSGAQKHHQADLHDSTHGPTVLAVSIVTACLCRSLADVRWVLVGFPNTPDPEKCLFTFKQPLLTPALLMLHRHAVVDLEPHSGQSQGKALVVAVPIAVGSAVSLLPSPTLVLYAIPGCGFFLSQLTFYARVIKIWGNRGDLSTPQMALGVVSPVAYRVVPLLLTVVLGSASVGSFHTPFAQDLVFFGMLKLARWVFVFIATQQAPWDIAATMLTFGASSSEPASGPIQAVGRVASGFAALFQTTSFVRRSANGRIYLFVFALCPLFLTTRNTSVVSRAREIWSEGRMTAHPIELLIEQQRSKYSAMLERQSLSLKAAVAEYSRRYKRHPPPGFDRWYEYARAQKSIIIDDYDIITELLEPFRSISPSQIRDNVAKVLESPDNRVMGISIKNHTINQQYHENWLLSQIIDLIGPFIQDLPDMDVAFNGLDEPRLLLSSSDPDESFISFTSLAGKSSWEAVTKPCRGGVSKGDSHFQRVLPFLEDVPGSKNICAHPEYQDKHALFVSPSSLFCATQPVPIFSPAAMSSFGDILYPSPFYLRSEGEYTEDLDAAWESKSNILYWAGQSSGGNAKDSSWRHHQRQRFVALVNNLENGNATYLNETSPGVWRAYNDTLGAFSYLYDVSLTSIIQCEESICQEEKEYFHPPDRKPFELIYESRFLFDLDGNSFSGHYYTLLRTKSVVFKQTLFREWHDERLFPWVHYVPVSVGLQELPETVRYLALTPQGQKLSKQIGESGAEWMKVAFRDVDAGVYLFRLLLEYGRVISDARDTM
ncbi:hypothetical protein GP486_001407 [Trichoglossum hirsutum]|uniref:Glycosyl transferase CAP10 domain-containing protein n=1 Tax=Trichoglossum hirsutum TaxID=265104 RepID=A0A9P8LGR2_9PEZI|nr:hypothetical protein GP486_001407 [Trichoglossum hirsutum]